MSHAIFGAPKALRLVIFSDDVRVGERVASAQFGWLIHARIPFLRPIGTRLMMGAATRTKASSGLLEGTRQ